MASDASAEVKLTIEQEGHKKWLCVEDGPHKARVRLPLHVEDLDPTSRDFHVHKLTMQLRRKLEKMKRGRLGFN